MKILKKIFEEIKIVTRTATYFAIVFILMMVMKKLYLKDYDIEFTGLSQAIIGALIMSKVVILMKLISLGSWVQRQPAIVDVILRTLLYSVGVGIVVLLEKAFEDRHKAADFGDAITYVLNHRDIYHVWASIIGTAGSLFVYNAFSIVQRNMGKKGFTSLYFSTPLNQVEHVKTPAK